MPIGSPTIDNPSHAPLASGFPFAQATSAQRRTLLAAALGWMLDAFDAMLYALVLAHVMRDLGMTKGTAGFLNSLTLLASGIGGVAFGFIADRLGRKRALMLSILTYSVCSFASGLATSVLMLAIFRFILGLGMGGEWNTGATLVAETWPTELRAKAISIVQSSWAIGYALAALAVGIVLHYADWRMAFFVGILPALVVLWIRRGVPESEMWQERHGRREDTVVRNSATSRTTDRIRRTLQTAVCETYFGAAVHEFLWDVCLVGTVYLDSALSVVARRARWARLRNHGNHHFAGGAESGGNVSRIRQLWLGRRLAGPSQVISHLYIHGSPDCAGLCHGEGAMGSDGAGHCAGVFRHGVLLRLGNYGKRNFSY